MNKLIALYMKEKIYNYIKGIILWTCLFITLFSVKAQEITIVPELNEKENEHVESRIKNIWSWWNVWKNYRLAVKDLSLSERWAGWIIGRNDIPIFLTLVVGFLSQIWLIVWVIFIMYAWYKYMVSVFNGWKIPTETIKNAIIWVIIIIFSYAIMKTLTSLVGIS